MDTKLRFPWVFFSALLTKTVYVWCTRDLYGGGPHQSSQEDKDEVCGYEIMFKIIIEK